MARSERHILTHAGTDSHDGALAKAEAEYDKYRTQQASLPSPVERHFDEAIEEVRRLQALPPEGESKSPPIKKPAVGKRKGKGKRR